MSILGSLFTAQTAIDAFGDYIGIAGDNIANLNTVGFKTSRQSFADLLPTVDGPLEVGHGVRLASVTRPFQQGVIENTENTTDLAIQGNGYFVLKNSGGSTFYSRAGQFHLDQNENLVNPAGLVLQGLGGDISAAGASSIAATPTSQMEVNLNLDASSGTPQAAFPGTGTAGAWIAASNFSTVTSVYDDQGNSHDLSFYFRKSAPNTWDYQIVAPQSEIDPSAAASSELVSLGSGGQLVFTNKGEPDLTLSTIGNIGPIPWVSGSTTSTTPAITLNFTHPETLTDNLGNVTTLIVGLTQYSAPSEISAISQNGSAAGYMTKVAIGSDGAVLAQYSNGQSRLLDTVTLALFPNVDDLEHIGDTLFGATLSSGGAVTGIPDTAGRGDLLAGALELSTVDLAAEFVTLLTSQRSFQVNSKVITTADEMFSVAVDLKR